VTETLLRIDRLQRAAADWNHRFSLFRVPGRVNLIGEHTDYNNCPVLPMAVDRDILALAAPREDQTVMIRDANPVFGGLSFKLDYEITPFPTGSWGNYFKAGIQEMIDSWRDLPYDIEALRGFDMVIDSTIPPAAGMSSSSALVVLGAMAFLSSNGIEISDSGQRLLLADLCAQGERYTGTQGGGMDQAAILLAERGSALKIDFHPLRTQPVKLPEGYRIVIAHSTVEAPKTQQTMEAYNRRSVECRLAASLIGRFLERTYGIDGIGYIGDLTTEKTGLTPHQLAEAADQAVLPSPYRIPRLAESLGVSLREAEQMVGSMGKRDFIEPDDGYQVHRRLAHVLSEWSRVEQSAEALEQGDAQRFGEYMNASHASCRDLHEISCPELDELTEISREAGAVGSRLTGAGFGGCTVNLVENRRLASYFREVGERYYRCSKGLEQWDRHLFAVDPADGAALLEKDIP